VSRRDGWAGVGRKEKRERDRDRGAEKRGDEFRGGRR